MSTDTRIPEGARVLYIGGGEEHNESLVGQFGTLTQDDGSLTLPYYVSFDSGSYNRWWCPPVALVRVPAVGDKVIPVNGELVGIPAEYRNAVGTVTGIYHQSGNKECPVRIAAEFHAPKGWPLVPWDEGLAWERWLEGNNRVT